MSRSVDIIVLCSVMNSQVSTDYANEQLLTTLTTIILGMRAASLQSLRSYHPSGKIFLRGNVFKGSKSTNRTFSINEERKTE